MRHHPLGYKLRKLGNLEFPPVEVLEKLREPVSLSRKMQCKSYLKRIRCQVEFKVPQTGFLAASKECHRHHIRVGQDCLQLRKALNTHQVNRTMTILMMDLEVRICSKSMFRKFKNLNKSQNRSLKKKSTFLKSI